MFLNGYDAQRPYRYVLEAISTKRINVSAYETVKKSVPLSKQQPDIRIFMLMPINSVLSHWVSHCALSTVLTFSWTTVHWKTLVDAKHRISSTIQSECRMLYDIPYVSMEIFGGLFIENIHTNQNIWQYGVSLFLFWCNAALHSQRNCKALNIYTYSKRFTV